MNKPYSQTVTLAWLVDKYACWPAQVWFRDKFDQRAKITEVWAALEAEDHHDWLWWAAKRCVKRKDYGRVSAYLSRRMQRAGVSKLHRNYVRNCIEQAAHESGHSRHFSISLVLTSAAHGISEARKTSYEAERALILKWLRRYVFKF